MLAYLTILMSPRRIELSENSGVLDTVFALDSFRKYLKRSATTLKLEKTIVVATRENILLKFANSETSSGLKFKRKVGSVYSHTWYQSQTILLVSSREFREIRKASCTRGILFFFRVRASVVFFILWSILESLEVEDTMV